MRQFSVKPSAIGYWAVLGCMLCSVAWADPLYSTTVPTGSSVDPSDVHGQVVPSNHSLVFSRNKDVIEAIEKPYLPPASLTQPDPLQIETPSSRSHTSALGRIKTWLKRRLN